MESTVQTFRAELKGPLGLHYAKHHVFPIHSHKQMCSIVDSTTLQSRVSTFAQSVEETKTVPVRYFMVKHFGFSRFSWNPISKVFKMALMAHDGWCESTSSVRLRIGSALDPHLLYLCVCSDERISGDAWAYPKFALSLWGCAAPNWLVSYRCCSSPTQLGQQTACAFSTSFFLYVHRMPTTVSRLACTRT